MTIGSGVSFSTGSCLVPAFVVGLAVDAFRVVLARGPMLTGAFFNE